MERLSWKINDVSGDAGIKHVILTGDITEDTNLDKLAEELKGPRQVRFELSGVQRINSAGVREWVNFIKDYSRKVNVELERCSPALVDQLNVFANFVGAARVISVLAPFLCVDCDEEASQVVELAGTPQLPPPAPRCGKCGQDMEFDNLIDHYFSFIKYLDPATGKATTS